MKKLSLVLAAALLLGVLAMSGCGGAEPSPLDGKWIGVGAEMMGIMLPVEDAFGGEFSINIEGVGKAKVTVGDASENDKWELEGDTFTLHMSGADCVGTWNEDLIVFENMLDTGVSIIFAKEGSAAADPSLYDNADDILNAIAGEGAGDELRYMPIEDDTLIGTWVSMGFSGAPEDPVEHDPELLGYDDIAQLMEITFNEDKTLKLSFNNAAAVSELSWHTEGGTMVIDSPELFLSVYYRNDDIMEVIMENSDTYMEVYLQRK